MHKSLHLRRINAKVYKLKVTYKLFSQLLKNIESISIKKNIFILLDLCGFFFCHLLDSALFLKKETIFFSPANKTYCT